VEVLVLSQENLSSLCWWAHLEGVLWQKMIMIVVDSKNKFTK
jgi:hypothetical protein